MKIVKILIAVLIAVGAIYWAFGSVSQQVFDGTSFELVMGQGNVVTITHNDENSPALVDMTARSTFSVTSSEREFSGSSAREGTGRDLVHRFQVELPAGTADFRIARGSSVTVAVGADTPVEAVMTPMSSEDARNTVIFATVVVLIALFYISRSFEHRWAKLIAQKVSRSDKALPSQPSTLDASQ